MSSTAHTGLIIGAATIGFTVLFAALALSIVALGVALNRPGEDSDDEHAGSQ